MTPPTLTFHGRLPGVACDPALPGVEQPIRLDVAAFVGFAERGPVDQPVVLSDALGFTAVFGGDHVLADDGGRPVYAHLPAAVRAFFDNGGVRCYAVRVGGADPRPSRWAVTGLQIWQPDNTVDDVVVEAAWPGRWSVGTRVSVEPVARPLAVGAAYQRRGEDPGQLVLPRGAVESVQPGDLLELDLGAGQPRLYVRARSASLGVVLTDHELTWRPGAQGSPPDLDHPDGDALAGLASVLPVESVTLHRMDLVVQRREDDQLKLIERFNDLAYAAWTSVLQTPGSLAPDLTASMNLRSDTATEAAAATGLVVPVAGMAEQPALVLGDDDLDFFNPEVSFVEDQLRGATVSSLVPDADRLTSLAKEPAQLHGFHALYGLDEVALVALPDLTHRGWSVLPPAPPDPDPEPPPPPPPVDWSDFRCCGVDPEVARVADDTSRPWPAAAVARRQLDRVAAYDEGPLLAVHEALLTFCAARADLVAVLSVPQHYDTTAVLDWHAQLTSANRLAGSVTSALTPLSYAAYWHPWLQVPEPRTPQLAPLRSVPPDGAVAGMIAARERSRGIWVAPAAVALRGPVGLVVPPTDTEVLRLFDAHANVIRQRPGSFAPISAHTLAEGRLLQLSVRRMLVWLRKVCLRAGQRYTFEVNNDRFHQLVQRRFERILADLAQRGAWHAFRVDTGSGVTTDDDTQNGRLVIALQVAPTSPVEFITVSLVRSGEGLLDVWEA